MSVLQEDFLTYIQKGNRIVIPSIIRETLKIKIGERVRVTIKNGNEESFLANIQKGNRIAITSTIRKTLSLNSGDRVRVTITTL